MIHIESYHNEGSKEPCYASLDEAKMGRNTDGTLHEGFLVIDPIRKVVLDLVDRNGKSVVYSVQRESYLPQKAYSFQRMRFDNDCSCVGFIGRRTLEDVIASDSQELEEMGGSFEAIADRMQKFIDFAKDRRGVIVTSEEFEEHMKPVFDKYKALYGSLSNIPKGKPKEEYYRDWAVRMAQHPKTWFDNKISVINYLGTRGFQQCPFVGCEKGLSSIDVVVFNRESERSLTVNPLTVHLARDHHLLEKDNEYGISAREFYQHFM